MVIERLRPDSHSSVNEGLTEPLVAFSHLQEVGTEEKASRLERPTEESTYAGFIQRVSRHDFAQDQSAAQGRCDDLRCGFPVSPGTE